MSKVLSFEQCLRDGREVEWLLCQQTGGRMTDGRKYDVEIPSTSHCPTKGQIEVKADFYESSNFIIKRMGNIKKSHVLDGPWKAVREGVDYYVIYKRCYGKFYFFRPADLAALVEENMDRYRKIETPTRGNHEIFTSQSYLVPIADAVPLIRHIETVADSI